MLGSMPQGALQTSADPMKGMPNPGMPMMGQPLGADSAVVQPQMAPQAPSQDSGGIANALRAYGNSGDTGGPPPEAPQAPGPYSQGAQQQQGQGESPYAALLRELPGLTKAGMGAYDAWNTPSPAAQQPMPSALTTQMQGALPQSYGG